MNNVLSRSNWRLCRVLILGLLLVATVDFQPARAQSQGQIPQAYRELLERSEKEKKGLTFYLKGQTVGGVVIKIGADTVEIRNQAFSRIIVRLDSIDAVAIN